MSSALPYAHRYHQWLAGLVIPYLGKRVLECGTGSGIMTEYLLSSAAEKICSVDIDPACIKAADIRLRSPRLTLAVCDISRDFAGDIFGKGGFDSIVIFNVLEHIAEDNFLLRKLHSLLAPGGRLLLLVPAFQALYGGMDRSAGHYRRYGKKELELKLEQSGFTTNRLQYVNPIGFFGWWFTNRVLKVNDLDSTMVNGQIRIFDKFVLPVSNFLQPLTGRFLGQSLFAIAERGSEQCR